MKNLKFLALLAVMFMTINGCKKDEPEQQEEQETLSEYHEIANCEIQFPEGTNTSAIGNITIYTAGDFKVIDLSTTANKSANNTQSGSDFRTEITIGKNTITLGSVLDENGQPIAYSVHIPAENNEVMFNATETAVAIVFMHPFLNNYDIETARTIVNKIKQSSHFLPLVNEVLDRMATGHLNISGQDFDPTSFSNFNSIVIDVVNSTYINATVNQDGIEIVDITQDNQYVKFKVKNNRKRWLKVVPSLFSNGNTSASSFYSELLDLNYPHDYCGSININLLRQYFTNPDLTSLSHTSREFVVQKDNAEQLYIDIYGLGLDEYGNFPQQLYDNHLDIIIISTFQDFVLPIVGIFTGINGLNDELRDDINIVGRPLNNPYKKMLGRLTTELLNDNDFRNDLIDLINNGKHILASKKIVKRSLEFIVSDTDHSSKNLYDILKETFGADVIKQNRAHFKTALKSYKSLLKAFSILNAGANINVAINTVIYSDWHNQKRIDLTYDNSPTMQTDPVITNITSSSATASGNIVDNNGSDVLESGICWSTTIVPPPSIADEHTTDGQPSGLYSSNITGLTPSTTYYIRAYAKNGNGIGYGDVVSFTTSEPETVPTLTTSTISNITSTTATSGGNITDDGGSAITARGVCYSTNPNPTTADQFTTDGTGMGTFTSSLTGLTASTTYYVRAYATNSEGTAYGSEQNFTTTNTGNNTFTGQTILVNGGTFTMGSPSGTGDSDEHPQHSVTVSSFRISKYEITNQQYADYMNAIGADANGSVGGVVYLDMNDSDIQISHNGSSFIVDAGKENYPVIEVSWYGAKAYSEYYGGRLPTEAEWEFAARGGNSSNGYTYSGSNTIDDVAWYSSNSGSTTHTVGTKNANELGLHDMSGNVWEWCNDWYDSNYYSSSPSNNPQGSNSGTYRVYRGGSWSSSANGCRVAYRDSGNPTDAINHLGFRPVFLP